MRHLKCRLSGSYITPYPPPLLSSFSDSSRIIYLVVKRVKERNKKPFSSFPKLHSTAVLWNISSFKMSPRWLPPWPARRGNPSSQTLKTRWENKKLVLRNFFFSSRPSADSLTFCSTAKTFFWTAGWKSRWSTLRFAHLCFLYENIDKRRNIFLKEEDSMCELTFQRQRVQIIESIFEFDLRWLSNCSHVQGLVRTCSGIFYKLCFFLCFDLPSTHKFLRILRSLEQSFWKTTSREKVFRKPTLCKQENQDFLASPFCLKSCFVCIVCLCDWSNSR